MNTYYSVSLLTLSYSSETRNPILKSTGKSRSNVDGYFSDSKARQNDTNHKQSSSNTRIAGDYYRPSGGRSDYRTGKVYNADENRNTFIRDRSRSPVRAGRNTGENNHRSKVSTGNTRSFDTESPENRSNERKRDNYGQYDPGFRDDYGPRGYGSYDRDRAQNFDSRQQSQFSKNPRMDDRTASWAREQSLRALPRTRGGDYKLEWWNPKLR